MSRFIWKNHSYALFFTLFTILFLLCSSNLWNEKIYKDYKQSKSILSVNQCISDTMLVVAIPIKNIVRQDEQKYTLFYVCEPYYNYGSYGSVYGSYVPNNVGGLKFIGGGEPKRNAFICFKPSNDIFALPFQLPILKKWYGPNHLYAFYIYSGNRTISLSDKVIPVLLPSKNKPHEKLILYQDKAIAYKSNYIGIGVNYSFIKKDLSPKSPVKNRWPELIGDKIEIATIPDHIASINFYPFLIIKSKYKLGRPFEDIPNILNLQTDISQTIKLHSIILNESLIENSYLSREDLECFKNWLRAYTFVDKAKNILSDTISARNRTKIFHQSFSLLKKATLVDSQWIVPRKMVDLMSTGMKE